MDEAIKEYQLAIQIDPKLAGPHYNLGNALAGKQQVDEAIKEYRLAIQLDPKLAMAHNNLAVALAGKRQLDEAIKEFRLAIELDPKYARFHGAIGKALLQLGRFAEARESTRRCLELLPRGDPLRQFATQQMKQCEQFLVLDQKLAAIPDGTAKPANNAERLALAQFCQQPYKMLYATSCRFYTEALADDPKLAEDTQKGYRYNAACAAALAGCGQGNDAAHLDDKERARLRKQAITWLRADLAHWNKQAESVKAADRALAQKTLRHWQDDSDLAGLRDQDALKKLPADESEPCRKLWADVAELISKIQEKTK